MKFSIHDEEALKKLLAEHAYPSFRYGQIENALYKNFIETFQDMQTIPKDLRDLLDEHCFYQSLRIDHISTSSNGQTTKYIFKTEEDLLIEAVIMRHLSGRNTLCISCQA